MQMTKPDRVKQRDWEEAVVVRQRKNAALQMIGVWNKDVKRKFTVQRTKFEEDMMCESAPDIVYDDHDVPSMIHACEQLDNVTYAPLGRIALYADILNLREERRLLNLHKHELKIL